MEDLRRREFIAGVAAMGAALVAGFGAAMPMPLTDGPLWTGTCPIDDIIAAVQQISAASGSKPNFMMFHPEAWVAICEEYGIDPMLPSDAYGAELVTRIP